MKSPIPLAAATVVVLAVAVTGCAGSGSSATTTLEFQTATGADSPVFAELEAAAEAFTKENPEIAIDVIPQTSSYEADMKVRLAADDVPDIMGTHGWSLLRYSPFLEPLKAQAWNADVNPALNDAMRGEDDEIYALPIVTDVAGLVVNYDVLESVGASASDLTTWSGFTEVAEKIAATGIAPIVVGGKDEFQGNVVDWMASAYYDEASLQDLGEGTWVNEPYEEMLTLVDDWRAADLFNDDYSSATGDDMARALADGQGAFEFGQNSRITAALDYNPDANIGYIPVPALEGGDPFLIGGEMVAFGTARGGEHLEESLKFLNFLSEPDRIASLAAAAGNAPGLVTADVKLAGPLADSYNEYAASGEVPLVPYFDRVYLPNGMWDTMVTTTDAVITGQQNPSAATSQMASDFDSLFSQSK
ncbi:ABC transporter substrate-binding protein [Microbacterium sp. Leaf159]|uniref:ABC transporter substrate-binding protein n=1 Tax=Microbacterium sp. Leaf159 TaxID=1736279 RepID=UPI000702375B|nr:extracellular solute-binding protein [Microbacterium sp. Leaf159]KQR39427.1 hypothetical protein ASF80_08430 [Microbacterium sp. Leaf159]